MIGDQNEPTNGIPSLTDGEIDTLYNKYFRRGPDARELASERENAMKYSAAAIERQIANRAGNVAGSGVRGDEGLPSLTIPAQHVGNVMTMGAAAIAPGATATGPVGNVPALYGGPAGSSASVPGAYYANTGGATIAGLPIVTVAILALMAGAAWYFLRKKG